MNPEDIWRVSDLPDGPVKESKCSQCGQMFEAEVKIQKIHNRTYHLTRVLCDTCCEELPVMDGLFGQAILHSNIRAIKSEVTE